MIRLDDKDPYAEIDVEFQLAALLKATETVTAASVTAIPVNRTVDASASAIVSGVEQISGTTVIQHIVGGVPNVDYELRCEFTGSLGTKEVDALLLPVRTI